MNESNIVTKLAALQKEVKITAIERRDAEEQHKKAVAALRTYRSAVMQELEEELKVSGLTQLNDGQIVCGYQTTKNIPDIVDYKEAVEWLLVNAPLLVKVSISLKALKSAMGKGLLVPGVAIHNKKHFYMRIMKR